MPRPAARGMATSMAKITPASTAAEIVARLRSRVSGRACAGSGRLIGPGFDNPGSGSIMLVQILATSCFTSDELIPSSARDLPLHAKKHALRALVVDDEPR